MVFLDPLETRPAGAAIEVGADHLPDVDLQHRRAARQAVAVRGVGAFRRCGWTCRRAGRRAGGPV